MTRMVTGEERRNGYEHLAPLFVAYRCLPRDDPLRRELRSQLITGYRPVAQNIAHRHAHRGANHEDLEQVATLGLIMAVDRFEPDREVDFLSFAVPTITGEVLRYFRDRSALVRVPRQLRTLRGQIYDAAAELGQRHGRAARPSEIAAFLEVDIEVVLEGLTTQAAGHTSSLDEPALDDSERGGRTRSDTALRYIEPHFDVIEDRLALGPLLVELPDRERTILHLRFFCGLTQTEIGQQVGISQMHVSRLLSRTLTSLRHKLSADNHNGIDPR